LEEDVIQVLDHGYVDFIEAWGTGRDGKMIDSGHMNQVTDYEVGIVEAARQSTQGAFRGWYPDPCDCQMVTLTGSVDDLEHTPECASVKNPGDLKLLSFLYNNNHATPFEFSGMVIEVQAPIMVFREWHRHRTQSYNEASARYSPLADLNYVPLVDRVLLNEAGANKQAQAMRGTILEPKFAHEWVKRLEEKYRIDEEFYQWGLAGGIPKELARLGMPMGHYSKMRASCNLRNWLAFMTLRCDPKAQWEIRQYANVVADLIAEKFPRTYGLFDGKRRKAC